MTSAVLDRVGAPDDGALAEPETGGRQGGGPGRTRIAARALEHVAVAIAAESLGVPTSRVTVSLADDRGALALVVTSPMRALPLGLIAVSPGVVSDDAVSPDAVAPDVVSRSGGSILDRAGEATSTIGARLEALSGSRVSRVIVRVSGLETARRGRVS